MDHRKKARLFQNGGSQAVRLPAEFRFEGEEVYISRDPDTGDVVLSTSPDHGSWEAFMAFRDALSLSDEEGEGFLDDRPMNAPVRPLSVFERES